MQAHHCIFQLSIITYILFFMLYIYFVQCPYLHMEIERGVTGQLALASNIQVRATIKI